MKSQPHTPYNPYILVPGTDAATAPATRPEPAAASATAGGSWLGGLLDGESQEGPAMLQLGHRPGSILTRAKGSDAVRRRAAVAQFLGALLLAFLVTWAVFSHSWGEDVAAAQQEALQKTEVEIIPQTQTQAQAQPQSQEQQAPQDAQPQPQGEQQPQPEQQQPQEQLQAEPQPGQQQPQEQPQEQPEQPKDAQPQEQAQQQQQPQPQVLPTGPGLVPQDALARAKSEALRRAEAGKIGGWMIGRGRGAHHDMMLSHALRRHRQQFHSMAKSLPPQVLGWRTSLSRVLLVISLEAPKGPAGMGPGGIGPGAMGPGEKGPGPGMGPGAMGHMLRTAAFLRQLYGRIFERLVILGPRSFPGLAVLQADLVADGTPGADFGGPGRERFRVREGLDYSALGWLGKEPGKLSAPVKELLEGGVDGVLWMSSDVVLNYWSIASADKSKFWVPRGIVTGPRWQWHSLSEAKEGGGPGAEGASEEQQLSALRNVWNSWPDWAKSNFAQNSGHDAGMVARGPLPVVYLPWQSISKLGPLVESLNAANVPSELALPQLVLSAFQPPEADPVLDSLADTFPETSALAKYQDGTAGLYPWDSSQILLRGELLRAMLRRDVSLVGAQKRWAKVAEAQANRTTTGAEGRPIPLRT